MTMSRVLNIELPDETYAGLAEVAARTGATAEDTARAWIAYGAQSVCSGIIKPDGEIDRQGFLKLPREEQDRVLAEQAERLADFYENDLEWREWDAASLTDYENG